MKKVVLGVAALALGACSANVGDEELGTTSEALNAAAFVGSPTNQAASDTSVVSRGSNDFDEFALTSSAVVHRHYTNAGGWANGVSLGKPTNVASIVRVAASATKVSAGVNRLDVFVTGSDNKIYHKFQTNPGVSTPAFSSWVQILNNPTVDKNGKLGVASWGNGRIDLFWWTQSAAGHLGHAYADNLTWSGTEDGDTAAFTWFQRAPGAGLVNKDSLAVAAKASGRLDIYTAGGQLCHHFFDAANGNFGTTQSPHRECGLVHQNVLQASDQPADRVVAEGSGGSVNVVTLVTILGTPAIYSTESTNFGSGAFSSTKLNIGAVDPGLITSLTTQTNPFRYDVWGVKNSKDWQAYFPN